MDSESIHLGSNPSPAAMEVLGNIKNWARKHQGKVSLLLYLLYFLLAVLVFVALYYLVRDENNGLVYGYGGGYVLNFLDYLYFSFVTITSLGYGDIRPIGAYKFIASLEVVTGLVMLGIFIGKYVSQNQEKLIFNIYRSNQREKIEKALDEFVRNIDSLKQIHANEEYKDITAKGLRHLLFNQTERLIHLIRLLSYYSKQNKLGLISNKFLLRVENKIFIYAKVLRVFLQKVKSNPDIIIGHARLNSITALIKEYYQNNLFGERNVENIEIKVHSAKIEGILVGIENVAYKSRNKQSPSGLSTDKI